MEDILDSTATKYYAGVTAGIPVSVTKLHGRGKGVVATHNITQDTEIWREEPIVCIQHLYSRYHAKVCEQCLCFIPVQMDKTAQDSGKGKETSYAPHEFKCGGVCAAVFCSSKCKRTALSGWHTLLCANRYCTSHSESKSWVSDNSGSSCTSDEGNREGEDMHDDNAILYFYKFAESTNDLLLLTARLVATIISAEEKKQLAGQTLLQNISYVHSAPWWEVATRDAEMTEDEREELIGTLRTLASECLVFFKVIFDGRPLTHEILNEDFIINTIGMFELNNADVIIESPTSLTDVQEGGTNIGNVVCERTTPKTGTNLEKRGTANDSDCEYDECDEVDPFCRGNALYRLQSCMNHSCVPNTIITRDGNSTIIVKSIMDTAKGEELTISYIDETMSREERQLALQDYGFHCTCDRCRNNL
eukprot:CFRG1710T1